MNKHICEAIDLVFRMLSSIILSLYVFSSHYSIPAVTVTRLTAESTLRKLVYFSSHLWDFITWIAWICTCCLLCIERPTSETMKSSHRLDANSGNFSLFVSKARLCLLILLLYPRLVKCTEMNANAARLRGPYSNKGLQFLFCRFRFRP